MDFEVIAFNRGYSREEFDCGNDELNRWLQQQAGQQEKRNNTRTFLGIADGRIIAYYSSITYQVDLDEAASAFGSGTRRYPMPAVLLARLAVDKSAAGHNVGRRLVIHFLNEMAKMSTAVGFEAVIVHAIDNDAAAFYAKCGFTPFVDHHHKLFITTKDLRRTFDLH